MRCFSPNVTLRDSSVVVRRSASCGLLPLACLVGGAVLVGIVMGAKSRKKRGDRRPLAERLRNLEELREQKLITDEECQDRRLQILQEI